jgi:nitrate/nitrite-specific signal transduction histidine kinase
MDFSRLLSSRFVIAKPRRSADVHSGFPLCKPGLSLKLLLIVVSVSLTGVLLSSLLVLTLQRRQLIESTQIATIRLSNAIEASLEHAMVENDWALVNQMIQSVVAGEGVKRIRILDVQGVVRVSSTSAEVGKRFDRSEPACQFCHSDGAQPDNQTALITSRDGGEALLDVNLILNQPRCAECHDPRSEVLGLLMIETPLVDLSNQLAASFWRMTLSAIATFALLVGLMVLALRKFVTRPVEELVRGAAEFGAGNLNYRVQVTRRDELGDLARAFTAMGWQLKVSRAEMERRNKELSVFNDVALVAGQLLDLQQVLDLVLDTAVSMLGMQAGLIFMLDKGMRQFTLRASRGLSYAQRQEIERRWQQPGENISQQIARISQAFIAEDMAADSRFQGMWDDLQERFYANIPLKSKSAVIGSMVLVTHAGRPLTGQEMEALEAMGHQISLVADHALLLAQVHDQQDEIGRLAERIGRLEEVLVQEKAEASVCRKSLDTLFLISEETGESLVTDQVFQKVADLLLEITGFSSMGVYIFDSQARCYHQVAQRGMPPEALAELGTLPADRGDFLTIAAQTLRPVFTSNHAADPRAAEKSVDQLGLRSIVYVPLLAAGQYLGVFILSSTEEIFWDEAQIRWLGSIGRQIGVIIHHAQLAEKLRVSAALEERVRLGRELHDSLAQVLGYLNLKSQVMQALLSSQEMALAMDELRDMEEVAARAYDDVRDSIFELRSSPSLGQDLVVTLQEYAREFGRRTRIDVSLDAEHWTHPSLPPETEAQVMRVFQEALTNVRRHARARHVQLSLRVDGDVALFAVKDDGQGFDPTLVGEDGRQRLGLQTMKERAESVGARLEVRSQRGRGTEVRIDLPLRRPGEGRE